MSATEAGRQAETAVADFLMTKGFVIVAQNWRTKWCEIDIVATRNGVVYFVEVKYRRSNAWGAGLEYVTPKKLQQMQFAAQFWIAQHNQAHDYRLAAAEVSGSDYAVSEWIDDIL